MVRIAHRRGTGLTVPRVVQVPSSDEDRGEVVAVNRLVCVGGRVARVAEPVRTEAFSHFGGDVRLFVGGQSAVVISGQPAERCVAIRQRSAQRQQ